MAIDDGVLRIGAPGFWVNLASGEGAVAFYSVSGVDGRVVWRGMHRGACWR